MKHLSCFLSMLFLGFSSIAQVPNCNAPTPLNEQFRGMLQNLDKSQIPTGILYEAVYPWAEIESYDGTSATDTSSYPHFMQAYNEIYNAKFNTNGLIHPNDLETAVKNFNPDPEFHHAFGIIDYQYNTINPSAVDNGQLYVANNKLYDVPGRTSSPYVTNTAELGTILMGNSSGKLAPGTHYLHFSPNFVLSNTGFSLNGLSNIQIYIDNNLVINQAVSAYANTIIPILIDEAIAPVVIVVVLVIWGVNKVYKNLNPKKPGPLLTPCGGMDTVLVTGDSYDGGYGKPAYGAKGRANIFYSDANCPTKRITRPIIFVDGFDPTNDNHAAELYDFYINAEYKDLNQKRIKLGDSLRKQGYDIITFDQADEGLNRGGGGFIENNALALAKFLETFYAAHSSTMEQDFVVVGASMGGLVSRYALTYMEHNNIPHHTRLFISFDSPQLGAQIPVGVQQFIDVISQFGGLKNIDLVKSFAVHQTDAAKQLLVHHSSAESETIQSHANRTIFINNLNALGSWPQLCRKIAISNGNRNGILKSTTPVPTPPNFEPLNACGYELDFGIKKRLAYGCTSAFCYKTHSQAYTQTSGTRCKSLDFTINNNIPLLKFVFGGGQFTTQSFYTQNANNASYDVAPGSKFGSNPLDIIDGWIKAYALTVTGHLRITKNNIPITNFIPTVSSVAYTFPNNEPFSVYKNFQGITLSKCAGTTPFDTVYAPSQDMKHVEINEYIANAFIGEIYTPKPISTCQNSDCLPYLTLNSPVPGGTRILQKAQKAIFIEPNFKADGANGGVVFKAAIGCNSVLASTDKPIFTPFLVKTTCSQPFEFDQAKNYLTCGVGFTTFHVFVRNIDINTYAEFSLNGSTWSKANILDNGWEITLPTSTQVQYFQARTADDRSRNIYGYLAYCN